MSIIGLGALELKPSSEFSASQTEQGGWTASQMFTMRESAMDSALFRNTVTPATSPTDLDPTLPVYWSFMRVSTVPGYRRIGNGIVELLVNFKGFSASGTGGPDTPAPQYQLRGSLGSRSILEHPTVVALGEADRMLLHDLIYGRYQYLWRDNKVQYFVYPDDPSALEENDVQPSGGDATTFAKLILQGIRTYLHPTFTWSKRWQDRDEHAAATLNNLGKIDSPDGDPPDPGTGRDWLLVNANQRDSGALYDLALDWQLSDDGGWDPDLYS